MAVTHPTAVRNEICDTIVDALNSGFMVLLESDDTEAATLGLNATAFGAAAAGVATANAITSDTSATGGVVAKGELQESDNTPRVLFSVTGTGGGGDVEMPSTTVGAATTVSCSSLTYESMP